VNARRLLCLAVALAATFAAACGLTCLIGTHIERRAS
jgi:hypothetical protein